MGHHKSRITDFQGIWDFNFVDLSLKEAFYGRNCFNQQSNLSEKFSVNSTDISGKEIWQGKKNQDPGGLRWEDAGVTTSGQVMCLINEMEDAGTSGSG